MPLHFLIGFLVCEVETVDILFTSFESSQAKRDIEAEIKEKGKEVIAPNNVGYALILRSTDFLLSLNGVFNSLVF